MKRVLLCILDGVGERKEIFGNAVRNANMPTYNMLLNKYSHSLLEASGISVGLPDKQMGNSEVGHSNIGTGRVVYQPYMMINNAIEDGSFFKNEEIINIFDHVKNNNSKLHICGLLSNGGVHSSIEHLMSLIDMIKNNNIHNVYFHIFLDGRDTKIDSGINFLNELKLKLETCNVGNISSISGRFYAMDRDNRYERIEKAYNVMVKGIGPIYEDYLSHIEDCYKKEEYDEFIEPFIVDKNGMISSNDGVITFNFRPDRLREIFMMITNPKSQFETIDLNNVKLLTMFPVSDDIICKNAFMYQDLSNTLGEYLESKNLKQLRIAETEKYAHVTYFFDGGRDIDLLHKDQVLIPSPKVLTYDMKPEMSSSLITDRLEIELNKKYYDFIVLNYANGDMVGHTGNYNKTIESLEYLDKCLERIYNLCIKNEYVLVVTADHGNSDYMIDENNNPVTTHSIYPVNFIVCIDNIELSDGKLADIAPTILKIMDLDVPKEMTGNILI